MSNPAPVLVLNGTVHTVNRRTVPALPALPEARDPETNRVTQQAREARDAYDTTDVTVLSEGGGFVTIVCGDEALSHLGGELPEAGQDKPFAVRTFVKWERFGSRSVPRVGLSVAGDLTAKLRESSTPRRLAATGS